MARSRYQQHVSGYMRRLNPHTMAEARAVVRRAAAAWSGRAPPRRTGRRRNPEGDALALALAVGGGLLLLHALGRGAQGQSLQGLTPEDRAAAAGAQPGTGGTAALQGLTPEDRAAAAWAQPGRGWSI
jgi:hypothetical protein